MTRRIGLGAALTLTLAALAACGAHGGEGEDCPAGMKAATPSGFCVPRYLSLKRGEVFARKGPGKDYPALFVYHAQGLPVQVVDETNDWRRICDPTGALVWVHRSMVDGRRTVMAMGAAPLPMRASPKDGASAAAYLKPKAVAVLGACQAGWCKVSADGGAGWVKPDEVWGLGRGLQCSLSGGFAPATGGR